MSMEIIKNLLLFAGGVGMFIYGMNVMAEGLQQAAGAKTKRMLEILTNNRYLGVLVGALVTAIIQSSSATTVMVVGFVNAQLVSLSHAVGVIMGANIGTTMTAWIVSMSEWGSLLKPEMIAPLLLVAGVGMTMVMKSERGREAARILIGFGLLFMGLSTMSGAVSGYADSPVFTRAFEMIGGNPLIGLLVGAGITAIMQSSSAAMGILQTLALAGVVNWGSAVFIALGQNIGTCVTALLSSVGADTNAKRAAMIHLEFNVIGSVIIGLGAWIYFLMNPAMMHLPVSSTNLALFHTGFNLASTILLFPFANQLVSLSKMLVHGHAGKEPLVHLDPRLLSRPAFALAAVDKELQAMGTLALQNIAYSRDCMLSHDHFTELKANEQRVDEYYMQILTFLEQLNAQTLSESEQQQMRHAMLALRDIEHVSDRAMEIASLSAKYIEQTEYSQTNVEDINTLSSQCYKAFDYALRLWANRDRKLISKVNHYEEQIDELESSMRESHMAMLQKSRITPASSMVFLEAVDCYERIADHAKLLAHYVAVEEGVEQPPLALALEQA